MSMTLYIGGIDYEVTPLDLRELFQEFGLVLNITLPTSRNKRRGYAFLQMDDRSAQEAMIALDGIVYHGRTLTVKPAINTIDYRGKKI